MREKINVTVRGSAVVRLPKVDPTDMKHCTGKLFGGISGFDATNGAKYS